MNNKNNSIKITDYFKQGEVSQKKIGTEFEHLIVKQDSLETIGFSDGAIENILTDLANNGWQRVEEKGTLVGLNSEIANITVEPGGQFEVSFNPCTSISEIKDKYSDFLAEVKPLLNKKGYYLLALGYQPESKIDDISWNPKKRYKLMSDYLEERGDCSHNMMKGTASLQMTLDYHDEVDFQKKFTVLNALSPLLAIMSDNSPFFEGKVFKNNALRTYIWNETDPVRTGIIKEALTGDFVYEDYAQFILDSTPILIKKGDEYISTADKKVKEIYADGEFSKKELEHILTMVFPDVRVKQFIEIRMMDAVPPDFSFALLAFVKGLIYNKENLERLFEFVQKFSAEEILELRKNILLEGFSAQLGEEVIIDIIKRFLSWSKKGLSKTEKKFLIPLEKHLKRELNPALVVKQRFKEKQDKKFAIREAIVNYWEGE